MSARRGSSPHRQAGLARRFGSPTGSIALGVVGLRRRPPTPLITRHPTSSPTAQSWWLTSSGAANPAITPTGSHGPTIGQNRSGGQSQAPGLQASRDSCSRHRGKAGPRIHSSGSIAEAIVMLWSMTREHRKCRAVGFPKGGICFTLHQSHTNLYYSIPRRCSSSCRQIIKGSALCLALPSSRARSLLLLALSDFVRMGYG